MLPCRRFTLGPSFDLALLFCSYTYEHFHTSDLGVCAEPVARDDVKHFTSVRTLVAYITCQLTVQMIECDLIVFSFLIVC